MPQYRVQLKDDEIADVLSFLRAAWGNNGSHVTASQVATARKATDPTSDQVVLLKMR